MNIKRGHIITSWDEEVTILKVKALLSSEYFATYVLKKYPENIEEIIRFMEILGMEDLEDASRGLNDVRVELIRKYVK